MIRLLSYIAIVALVAGLTHFSAILLLPSVATKDAYDLLFASRPEINRMMVLPAAKPGDTLIPFRDPATVQGLCFYDVRQAPVRVKLRTEDGLLTLSFRTPDGRIFYSMTDRAALNGTIDIRLVTPSQLDAIEANEDDDQGLPSELRLKVSNPRGLLVVTLLNERPNQARENIDRINAIICRQEAVSPPS